MNDIKWIFTKRLLANEVPITPSEKRVIDIITSLKFPDETKKHQVWNET